jgi:hypothetical protein
MAKPHAIPESLVCSECGLAWSLHPKKPRRRDCIKLLKARVNTWTYPVTYTYRYCNWGHYGCSLNHTGNTGTYYWRDGTYHWSDTSSVSTTNVIPLKTDDDPDDGVIANVG